MTVLDLLAASPSEGDEFVMSSIGSCNTAFCARVPSGKLAIVGAGGGGGGAEGLDAAGLEVQGALEVANSLLFISCRSMVGLFLAQRHLE